jgi:hypothetical protein
VVLYVDLVFKMDLRYFRKGTDSGIVFILIEAINVFILGGPVEFYQYEA